MARVSNLLGVQERTPEGGMTLPPPSEFPKMVYGANSKHPRGYVTKIVRSKAEEDALGPGWLKTPKEIHALLDKIVKSERDAALADQEPEAPELRAK